MATTATVVPNFATISSGGNITATGQFIGANGTAAAPSFAFTNDLDVGMYRAGSNSLAFSTGGTVAITISSAQVATFAAAVILPIASDIGWAGSTRLFGATNGFLRITNTGDTSPTNLAAGITIGTASVGSSLVYDSTYGLRSMTFDHLANSGLNGTLFNTTNAQAVNFGIGVGVAGQSGLGCPSATSTQLVTNNLVGLLMSSTQNIAFYGTGGAAGTNTGAAFNIKSVSANTTLNLGGVSTTIVQIPAGSIVLAVTARVTTLITAALSTSWSLVAGAVTYATGKAFASGTTVTSADYGVTFVGPTFYAAATNLVVTLNTDTATAGVVRGVVHYYDTTAPTA